MKQIYPSEVTWFMLATLGAAFLCLIGGSPPHRGNDPLFFFILANACGLFWLCIILHHEKKEDHRENWIRAFFLMDWVLGVAMAGWVIWKHIRAGTF
jgi:hypothetical protein